MHAQSNLIVQVAPFAFVIFQMLLNAAPFPFQFHRLASLSLFSLAFSCLAQSSVNLSSKWMLKIMTNNPIVTIINSANPNQPNTRALVPTPLLTLPVPKSWAICAPATEAVCCQRTLTRTKIEAMKMSASAT